jgi:hypothetical protein
MAIRHRTSRSVDRFADQRRQSARSTLDRLKDSGGDQDRPRSFSR